jgi:uncharacterized tellurite resistance protein B-like protein
MSKMTTLPVDLRLQSFRNLLEVASQDESVTGSESKVLDRIARRWGLTEEDASRASLLPANGKAEQSDPLIRFDELCELVELALADNVLDEREASFCRLVAVGLGFPAEHVDRIVLNLVRESGRVSREDLAAKLAVS